MDGKLTGVLDSLSASRRERDQRLQKMVDEYFAMVKSDIQRENQMRTADVEVLNKTIEDNIPKISEDVRAESQLRQQTDQDDMKDITQKLVALNAMIQQEKKTREDTEQQVYDMLKDVVS